MKFYDLGDNDYDMASPYRLHIPERGLELSYGKPGAMVFVTTNGYQDDYGREVAGRCVFGTDNERAHADLKKKLGQGERITMRGVLWPEYNVMTVWETFSNMSEFRELMKVVAGGLRDELELNPEDVLLYLGYSHQARGEERNYDMYNVELSVGEACVIGGHGDVNDCFYALFLKDKATRKDNGDIASNGMRNRDIWRHYEVVGENRKTTGRVLSESYIKEIIKRTLLEEVEAAVKQEAAQQVADNAKQVAQSVASDPNNNVTPQQAQTAFQGLMSALQNFEEGLAQFRENFNLLDTLEKVFGKTPLWRFIQFLFGDNGENNGQNYRSYGYRGNTAYKASRGQIDAIIVHCTATEEGNDLKAADIDAWHKQRGFRGIGYNYVIDLDGTIEQGRPEGTVGAHCTDKGDSNMPYNSHSIGISYIGGVINSGQKYFDKKKGKWRTKWTPKDTRTPQQKAAMERLITQLIQKYPAIKEVLGHREAGANKACPCFDASAEYSRLIPADRPMTPIRQAGLQRGGSR